MSNDHDVRARDGGELGKSLTLRSGGQDAHQEIGRTGVDHQKLLPVELKVFAPLGAKIRTQDCRPKDLWRQQQLWPF